MKNITKILITFLSLCLAGMAYAGSCGSDCGKKSGNDDKADSSQSD